MKIPDLNVVGSIPITRSNNFKYLTAILVRLRDLVYTHFLHAFIGRPGPVG
jgi:hypothetical protein